MLSTSRVSTCRVQRRLDSPWPRGMQAVIGGWGWRGSRRTFQVRRALRQLRRRMLMMMMTAGHCAPLALAQTWRARVRTSHSSPACPQAAGTPAVFAATHRRQQRALSLSLALSLRISLPPVSISIVNSPLQHPHTLALPPLTTTSITVIRSHTHQSFDTHK